jgi:hypothetical protein
MIEQGLFNRHFVGRDGFNWWIGQIPPEESWRDNSAGVQNDTNSEQKGFGERCRVRILGHHTANAEDIPDDELPWAYVMYPVTAGGGGRGSSQSANLTQGTFVFGWFMDGEEGQLPIIMGILGNNDYNAVMKNVTPTRFIPFDGYPAQDEVHGELRSTLQVRNADAGEILTQENATGQPVNNQYTSSAQGNTSTKTKNDEESKEDGKQTTALKQTSVCEPVPMGSMVIALKNAMNEVQRLQKMLYDARASLAAGTAEIQKWIRNAINKATKEISGAISWVIKEIQKFTSKRLNNLAKKAYSLVPPDLREALRTGTVVANDLISCLFRQLMGELQNLVSKFLSEALGDIAGAPSKAINATKCFVEDFLGGILGGITGQITSALNDALGSISSLANGVIDLAADVLGFVQDVLAFLTCSDMNNTACPTVNEWSIWDGPGNKAGNSDLESLINNASGFSSKFNQLASQAENVVDGFSNIDLSSVFANPSCDLGPRSCGPPTVEFVGNGKGALINLVVSATGSVVSGDVVSPGYGFLLNQSYLNVYDDCGKGTGAVIRPVLGSVTVRPEVTDDGITSDPDENGTDTGVIGIVVEDGGTGYLPRPDGSTGGDGSTWAEPEDTVIINDLPDGSTDYYPPIPPGNTVPIPPGGTVTTPPNSNPTEVVDGDGNQIEILPGAPTIIPDGGTITSPPINTTGDGVSVNINLNGNYPSSTSYPVILYLCELIVDKSGMDYDKDDEIIIEPDMGATASAKFDDFGRLLSVKITAGGEGFQDIPEVYIKSDTGFGARMIPKFCIDRLGEDDLDREPGLQDKVVNVIDCVGKF